MRVTTLRQRLGALVVLTLAAATPVALAQPAHAASTDVVINELLYHVPDGDPQFANLEFIELTNTGSATVDLGGWRFTTGITVATSDTALPAGLTLAPGGYLVGSSDPALYQAKFGRAPDFSFAGSALSNGGEQVTLVDGTGATADDLTYDDAAPWPTQPDGFGGSLELDNPTLDNADAASWHASLAPYGSPRAANSVAPLAVSAATPSPAAPSAGQPVSLSVSAPVGSTVRLTYTWMYAADTTVPMLDDAASPGGANDGVYAATVPAGGAGQLLRWKVAATKGSATGSYPPPGDTRPYDGLVVQDPALNQAQLPVLQWFMADSVYQDMITNHRCDDVDAVATFAWNGQVLDGGAMHIKGHSTCQDAKAKWDVELPGGYTFDFGGPYTHPVKKFDLQNESIPTPRLGWEMIGASGEAQPAYQTMRIQRNGKFFGVFGVLENYDGTFRSTYGWKDAAFYKVEQKGLRTYSSAAALAASGDLDKKNPDDGDFSDIWQLTQMLAQADTPAKQDWLRTHLDLPQIANYTAVTVVMRHWDSGSKNYYVVANPDTGRWQVLSWDLDGILNAGSDSKGDFVFPTLTASPLWKSLYAMPDFRAMHYRRVRQLADRLVLSGTQVVDRFDALTKPYANDIALDRSTWGGLSLASARNKVVNAVQERRTQIAAHTNATEIPTSQPAAPSLVVDELRYQPPSGAEFLEVYNPANTAIDISGWTIPAIGDYRVAPGTVVLPHGYAVWTDDDAALVTELTRTSFLMAGQYGGALSNSGEPVELFDGTRLVDSVTYAPSAPWPTSPAGGGPSLELVDTASDNALASSWAASAVTGGTPGTTNSVSSGGGGGGGGGGTTTPLLFFGAAWKYLSTSTNIGTAWRASAFDDSAWPTGTASFGCRAGQTTDLGCVRGRFTYYFRTSVDVPAGGTPQAMTLTVKRDDGIVVYVNGIEVARDNMPGGTIAYKTKATANVNVAGRTQQHELTLPPSAFVPGAPNVVAVELHQYSAGSTADAYFDARLDMTR